MSSSVVGRVNRAIAFVCEVILYFTIGAIFIILCTDVGLRYLTGSSLRWAAEIPELLFPWLVMAGVVLAAQHGAHIATVFVADLLGAGARRALASVCHVVIIVAYAVLAFITVRSIPIVHDERSAILGVPGSITYTCLLVGFVLIVLVHLAELFHWITPRHDGQAAGGGHQ